MTTLHLPEARSSIVALTDDQAHALGQVGMRLAGESRWWGSSEVTDYQRSVIRPTKQADGRWLVDVGNVVGAVGVPGLTVVIEPKIGIDHFAHLLSRARGATRVESARTSLASADELQRLVIEWYVLELRLLLGVGLIRDYVEASDALAFVRGRVNLESTSRRWLSGRLVADCFFEDFTENTPLNRTLAAAAERAIHSPWVDQATRRQLLGIMRELPDPGFELTPTWAMNEFTPRERHYIPAIQYAMDILAGSGRRLAEGEHLAGTFLLNSALIAEEGIRAALADGLAPVGVVKTGGRMLLPALVSVNPDLEIGPPPFTGDVKYKVGNRSWNRQDLAQSVLFAAAYRSRRAIIADFTEHPSPPRTLHVGDIQVSRVRWHVGPGSEPSTSEASIVAQIRQQLGGELAEWMVFPPLLGTRTQMSPYGSSG